MNSRALILSLALLTLTSAVAGCAGRRGGGGDDDDSEVSAMGGLDANGDGLITPDEVGDGQAGIYTETDSDDGTTEEGAEVDASLTWGDGTLGLAVELDGEVPMRLTLWFDAPLDVPDPTEDPLTFRYATAQSDEFLLWMEEGEGEVQLTEFGSTASGWFEGSVTILVADQFESPTGQTVHIEAFAFNNVPFAG